MGDFLFGILIHPFEDEFGPVRRRVSDEEAFVEFEEELYVIGVSDQDGFDGWDAGDGKFDDEIGDGVRKWAAPETRFEKFVDFGSRILGALVRSCGSGVGGVGVEKSGWPVGIEGDDV